jgi:hypothetical protein
MRAKSVTCELSPERRYCWRIFPLRVNGRDYALDLDPRTTLLDALREHVHQTGRRGAIRASVVPAP